MSDLSAVHGVRDLRTITSRTFVLLTSRLYAYPSAVQAHFRAQVAAQQSRTPSAAPAASQRPAAVNLTPEALRQMNARLVSVGQQPIGYSAVNADEEAPEHG